MISSSVLIQKFLASFVFTEAELDKKKKKTLYREREPRIHPISLADAHVTFWYLTFYPVCSRSSSFCCKNITPFFVGFVLSLSVKAQQFERPVAAFLHTTSSCHIFFTMTSMKMKMTLIPDSARSGKASKGEELLWSSLKGHTISSKLDSVSA